MTRWCLFVFLLLPTLTNASPTAHELLIQGDGYLAVGRLSLAAKRYGQVLAIDPSNRIALFRQRQIPALQQAYSNYGYERIKIEGVVASDGSHWSRSGQMEPLDPRLSEEQATRIRNAYTKYREQLAIALKANP